MIFTWLQSLITGNYFISHALFGSDKIHVIVIKFLWHVINFLQQLIYLFFPMIFALENRLLRVNIAYAFNLVCIMSVYATSRNMIRIAPRIANTTDALHATCSHAIISLYASHNKSLLSQWNSRTQSFIQSKGCNVAKASDCCQVMSIERFLHISRAELFWKLLLLHLVRVCGAVTERLLRNDFWH